MIVIVTRQFVGFGYNVPAVGSLLDVPDDKARQLLSTGAVERYEMKVDPLPPEIKKKELSA